MIYTQDNNCGNYTVSAEDLGNIQKIAGRRICDLKNDAGSAVWLFPREKDRYGDKIEKEVVFTLDGDKLTTGNIMGFISCGGSEVTIHSRFSSRYEDDYFMHYLLQKVFAINIFDLDHSRSNEKALDMTVFLFPYFLQKALLQGLYREYQRIEYNDDRVRGVIDFNRHIRMNYPFKNGKVAYSTKEYRYDNSITQLIRHTIEHIQSLKQSFLLYANNDIKAYVQTIVDATPSYCKGDLVKVIAQNIRPKIHPYYSEYRPLQLLCLQILMRERISYGINSEKIHGVLFDGAWLWEEYLKLTFLKAGFDHPENRTGKGRIHVFKNNTYSRYPDFIKKDIIADAKYKILLKDSKALITPNLSRDDLHQMITYMHITSSRTGIFVCPNSIELLNHQIGVYSSENSSCIQVGELKGDGGDIYVIVVNIPPNCPSYREFCSVMSKNEDILHSQLLSLS